MKLSAYHSLLRSALRPTRCSSIFCASNIQNHRRLHNSPTYSCRHNKDDQSVKSANSSQTDDNTKPVTDTCFDNPHLIQKELKCDSKQIIHRAIMSQSRHLKQSLSRASYTVSKFHSANNLLSSSVHLEQSCAFYHQNSSSPTFRQRRLGKVNSLFSNCLLGQPSLFQTSHKQIGSFSPTKLILESSPFSIQPYLRLIRFDKPIGSWLLYWPCTWSIALAADPGCWPDLRVLALFGAGAFFMRGAGCIINDMWDKDIDSKVARTKLRPLAAGEITQSQALAFLAVQLSCALAILLQLNNYSIVLGAASLGLVITYPLFKRFTYWPQLVLGLTLNWGVLLAWSSLKGSLELPGLILYLSCSLYTVIYDTIYSHQDKYDDMLIGIKSTALLFGDQTKPWLSVFAAAMTGGLAYSGYLCDVTWPYYTVMALTGANLAKQIYSVNLNDADQCAQAFRGNFYLGAAVFVGIVLANLLRSKEESTVAENGESAMEEAVRKQ